MASVPPQPQASRRPTPSSAASTTQSTSCPTTSSSAEPLESSISSDYTFAEATSGTTTPSAQTTATPRSTEPEPEPRRCWICFSDETDDTPESGIWRSPCPCNLEAHETCLLQWVADIEAPKTGHSVGGPAEIRCPQCKAKIYLARPRSYVVDAVGAVEKHFSGALLPAVVLGISYTVLLGASHHGAHTIRMLFGVEEAEAMLEPLRPNQWSGLEQYAMQNFPAIAAPLFRNWRGTRIELGLPFVPAILVASRTSLADAALPLLPIIFFASHPDLNKTLKIGYWPPSAALTFVVLPYIRSAYNSVMERTLLPYERRWLAEVKPQLGAEEAEAAEREAAAGAAEDLNEDVDIINIEIGMDMNMFGNDTDDEDEEDMPELENIPAQEVHEFMNRPAQAPPLHAPPEDDAPHPADDAAPAPDVPFQAPQGQDAAPQPAPARQRHEHRHEIDLVQTSRKVADSVVGALLFPTIAAGCGELLRLLLPLSWTVATRRMYGLQTNTVGGGLLDRMLSSMGFNGSSQGSSSGGSKFVPTGLLQTRWGRSVVGGCLFVIIKDMVRIYCRWRMAVSFRERKVRDWDKKKGKLVD